MDWSHAFACLRTRPLSEAVKTSGEPRQQADNPDLTQSETPILGEKMEVSGPTVRHHSHERRILFGCQ